MTEQMKMVLLDVKRGKSPFDNLAMDARKVARAVRQCTEQGLIAQPHGQRVLTEAGRKVVAP